MTQTKFKPVEEQLAYLKKGVAEIIPEAELKAKLDYSLKTGKPLRVYLGVDPTAPDLHLGHTVVLRKLKHFQDLGHTAVFLIGDFSAMIGDPTGVSETRPPLTREQVDANAKTYLAQVFKILDREKTEVRYNSEWLDKLSSYDVVRLCGHYQLSRLLEREDFRKRLESGQAWELRRQRREALRSHAERLEVKNPPAIPDLEARETLTPIEPAKTTDLAQPISVHELLYPLLTAYDAVMLKSDVELGATEQKFNLLVHREIQREYGLPGETILTMPILVGLDGQRKMSKSLGNYVGITELPNEMFKDIMRIPDFLMWDYLKLLTDKPSEAIEALQRNVKAGTTHPKHVKLSLASEIVRDFHGEAAAQTAARNWQQEVGLGLVPDGALVKNLPEDNYIGSKPGKMKLSRVMLRLDAAPSRAEAERLIKQGAVQLDDAVITDPTYEIDLNTPRKYLLRVGKKTPFYFTVQG
jgi:tyrosyl-tRNA synthetase